MDHITILLSQSSNIKSLTNNSGGGNTNVTTVVADSLYASIANIADALNVTMNAVSAMQDVINT